MTWVYVCVAIVCVPAVFLWLTALSGTRFYEVSMSRKDIKTIKWFIHLALVTLFIGLSFMVYKGNEYVQKMESEQKTEEVQTGQP